MIKLSGTEKITSNDKAISDIKGFWAWSYSDLKEPTNRGDFAEYLTYLALNDGLSQAHYETRMDWDVVDFVYGSGILNSHAHIYFCNSTEYGWGIEVKSSSGSNRGEVRFQTPERNGHHFRSNTPVKIKRRWADIYIFALFNDDQQYTKDILDTGNWIFYVVPAYALGAASIGVSTLESMGFTPATFHELKKSIDNLVDSDYKNLKEWKEQHDTIKKEYIEKILPAKQV